MSSPRIETTPENKDELHSALTECEDFWSTSLNVFFNDVLEGHPTAGTRLNVRLSSERPGDSETIQERLNYLELYKPSENYKSDKKHAQLFYLLSVLYLHKDIHSEIGRTYGHLARQHGCYYIYNKFDGHCDKSQLTTNPSIYPSEEKENEFIALAAKFNEPEALFIQAEIESKEHRDFVLYDLSASAGHAKACVVLARQINYKDLYLSLSLRRGNFHAANDLVKKLDPKYQIPFFNLGSKLGDHHVTASLARLVIKEDEGKFLSLATKAVDQGSKDMAFELIKKYTTQIEKNLHKEEKMDVSKLLFSAIFYCKKYYDQMNERGNIEHRTVVLKIGSLIEYIAFNLMSEDQFAFILQIYQLIKHPQAAEIFIYEIPWHYTNILLDTKNNTAVAFQFALSGMLNIYRETSKKYSCFGNEKKHTQEIIAQSIEISAQKIARQSSSLFSDVKTDFNIICANLKLSEMVLDLNPASISLVNLIQLRMISEIKTLIYKKLASTNKVTTDKNIPNLITQYLFSQDGSKYLDTRVSQYKRIHSALFPGKKYLQESVPSDKRFSSATMMILINKNKRIKNSTTKQAVKLANKYPNFEKDAIQYDGLFYAILEHRNKEEKSPNNELPQEIHQKLNTP